MGYTHSRSVMAGLDTVNGKGTDGHASYPDCEGVDMLPYRQGRILPPVDCKAGDGERYVGLSKMCYRKGKEERTCLGERQFKGRMGKWL